jgi:hypothetical protein
MHDISFTTREKDAGDSRPTEGGHPTHIVHLEIVSQRSLEDHGVWIGPHTLFKIIHFVVLEGGFISVHME